MERFKFISLPTGRQVKNKLDALPKTSGVYCFINKKETIYIGKAINIQNRVKNHFNQPSYRDELFIDKVNKVGFLETNSEIEALILEANLIKKHQPKFNVVWRDDKNYFYVALRYAQGKLAVPYITITHQKNDEAEYIGPFVEGVALKKTLRFLRRVFPYYTVKKHPKTKCTYCHLGLCPGPYEELFSPSTSLRASSKLSDYKKNIKKLILILQGKRSTVLNSLKKEMRRFSRENKFEEAGKIRDRIFALQQVMAHTEVINSEQLTPNNWQKTKQILSGLTNINKKISRIECYDVSNIQGNQATGSMVVFVDGTPAKSQYKKFRIRMKNKPNDIAMLQETLQRRFLHPEWIFPEIILIDGGIAQLNIAIKVKNQFAKNIKVISIAKRNKDLYIEGKKEFIPLKSLPREIYNLILQLDDEAHRFAINYHKKLRKKSLLE